MQLAGYELNDVIYAVGETVVASATAASGDRVVLKYLDSARPAPEISARWRHEFAVLRSIESPFVIRARALEQVGRSLVLVLENFAASNLAQLIARNLLDFSDQLSVAIRLTRAISDVHQHRLIHGDIAPKNVLIDPATLAIKLCDFGLCTRLDSESRQNQGAYLRGTLDYMSPEQTGRTNLDVDYRSDFYSLGVTLYELFSGRKPFESADPMTLLHAQIAQQPTLLHELEPSVPPMLSALVHKLLAKQPGDRYQSSFGLLRDLEHCAEQWHLQQRIDVFELARADVPERFCVAQRLYGRDAERHAVLSAFDRASRGRVEWVLISGYSGIGKTALVSELHLPVVARRGYFIRGKCDQYSRNQPYSALVQAFQQLMRQLAVEGPERRHYWRARLGGALGDHAAAVTEIIPDLSLLIGAPPPLPALPAAENEQRFHIAFAQFVAALAARNHPLLVFLDDLQWADPATLRLLEHLLLREGECSALIVGAYRDNEVAAGDPLRLCIAAVERQRGRIETLSLGPLPSEQVVNLVADSLHCSTEVAAPLAALCQEKTQGNPFFLGQFLRSLHAQGDLHYQRSEGAWRWNLEQIRQRRMTDNVVELMLQKLATLGPDTRQLLARAAHLGDSFDHRELMAVDERDATATAAVLWPALQAGLVVPLDEDYKFEDSPARLQAARYRFLHDRVQQAAHELVAESERPALQLRCGRLLLAASSEAELDERLFIILESLNGALPLIAHPAERAELLRLNLRGGLRAKAASAFPAAVRLLRIGQSLLAGDAWSTHPVETLTLYTALAEAEYLSGNFAAAEQLYPEALAAAPSALAKVSLCLVQADQYHIQGRFNDAFPVLRHALALLGRDFPDTEEAAAAVFPAEFEAVEHELAQRNRDQLLGQDEMRQPEHLLEMRAYFALTYATYQTGRLTAFGLDAVRMVAATLRHGQSDLCAVGYVSYVTAMSAMRRPYPACYAMGRLALSLAERRSNQYVRLAIYQYFAPFYQHWCEPLGNTLPYLEKGVDLGLAGINPLAAGYCALLRSVNGLLIGRNLDELQAECEAGLAFLHKSHQPNTAAMLRFGVLQPVLALRGKTFDPLSFDSSDGHASAYFDGDYRTPSIPLALYSAAMLRHAYLLDDPEHWQRFAPNLDLVGRCLPDSPSWVDATWFYALGSLKAGFVAEHEQADALLRVAALAERFALWAEGCAANFRHKGLLLSAELARVRGDTQQAMELYAQAIDAASESGFVHAEALCNELYARFWQAQHQKQLASNFIREAYYHYRRWGAQVKCRQLESQWPRIAFRSVELRHATSEHSSSFRHVSEQSGLLDLHSMLKASHLLSQEIHLESLLQNMLGVLLENAGAEQGAIVVDENGELIVEARGSLAGGRLVESLRIERRLSDLRGDASPLLPVGLIEYVQLTRATLVVNDPASDERFAQCPYLRAKRPKSVLCLPVLTQGKLVALIYLENNLMQHAFTARHLKTLELLSAQAAISLVNARLYESLELKVQQRTEELRQMSMRDGLTGIANRRSFDERLSTEWRRALRGGQPLSLLMIDIDHFKLFNDHYGHLEGDRCIRAVAQALQRTVSRSSDLVARYGGEEFAIVLPEADANAATQIAHACLEAIAELAMPHVKSPAIHQVSISIGSCTLLAGADTSPEQLITQADQALYQAKRLGRNRYCAFVIEAGAEA